MTSHDVWVFLFVLLCIPHMPLVLYMQAFVFFSRISLASASDHTSIYLIECEIRGHTPD